MIQVTYYLEVISSWCHWAEPAWSALKQRYADRAVFDWKIAQMPAEGYPVSQSQCDWYYRRSGSVMRSPYMLNSGWLEPEIKVYQVPNQVAEAARVLGVKDDRVRLAIAHAGVREGLQVGRWEVCLPIAATAGGLSVDALEKRARSSEVNDRLNATTAEFHNLQVTQRPTFLFENSIGDRAVLSGLVRVEPMIAIMDALLSDEAAYVSYKTHFGDPPAS